MATERDPLEKNEKEAKKQQQVTKPTREDHLLDLVLTNMSGVRTSVLPCIADHKLVVAEMPFKVPEQADIFPTVWQYPNADWDKLRSEFDEATWDCMVAMDADTAARHLETTIRNAAEVCIPPKMV